MHGFSNHKKLKQFYEDALTDFDVNPLNLVFLELPIAQLTRQGLFAIIKERERTSHVLSTLFNHVRSSNLLQA
jgi:hypothetical protein